MMRAFARFILSLITGSLWRWPLALMRWIAASPARIWAAMTLVALTLAGWQAHRAAQWADTARQTKLAWDKERTTIQSASKQAAADQAAVNHRPAAASVAIAEKSNAQAPGYYRHALDVADLHRVRPAPKSSARPADLPRADHPAPVNDRPTPAAELVCRPEADDKLLVGAAARAAQMHTDAQALIAAGAAKASE